MSLGDLEEAIATTPSSSESGLGTVEAAAEGGLRGVALEAIQER